MEENDKFNSLLGRKLRAARKSASMTQQEVASFMDCSQDSISKYERGNASIGSYKLLQFSRLYKKPINFFYMEVP